MRKLSFRLLLLAITLNLLQPSWVWSGQINIPTGVFVAFQPPDHGKGIPGDNKHITATYNPDNGRIYITGGDYVGTSVIDADSYRQETWSLSLQERFTNSADRNAGWQLEYPYCGPVGGVQPKHPDMVGWTWDRNRKVFWMVPGLMVKAPWNCPGESYDGEDNPGFLMYNIMTFNPFEPNLAKRWQDYDPNKPPHVTPPEQWMSTYDPVKDELIQLTRSSDAVADHYNVKTKTWSTYPLGKNAIGKTIYLEKEGVAADMESRVIYTHDTTNGRLHRYNIDAHSLTDLGPVPDGPHGLDGDLGTLAWDSINKVLFVFHYLTNRLHVYHPDTKTWKSPPMVTDISRVPATSDSTVSVRSGIIFDPGANALVLLGTRKAPADKFWVYRYGNSSLPPPPSAPINLQVK